ncbi:recombinase family protein [Fusobacteria bacterium ZRK30]|nr:recombinase family protein [Fusobacteria bacterium ZRK30]
MDFGYARTSTKSQNLDRQLKALKDFGVEERFIHTDQYTGTTLKRNGLDLLLKDLSDFLGYHRVIIKELDRLGRNRDETKEFITKCILEKGHRLVVLDMPYVEDFLEKKISPIKSFTNKIMESVGDLIIDFALLVAEEERNKIIRRTSEGRERAVAKGVKLGRKKIEIINFDNYYQLWKERKLNVAQTCKEIEYRVGKDIRKGISRYKFYEVLKSYKNCE